MRKLTSSFEYQEFASSSELSPEDRAMLELARNATATSHAPYSCYHVGAAVRLANGQIFTGSNQENMAFPAGLCAERVAVYTAAAAFPEIPVAVLAITAKADAFAVNEPVTPCGMCRQSIVEYEIKFGHKIRIILGGETGKVFIVNGMSTLLPLTFLEKGLQKPK
jgi:cytidine deaminase